MAKLASSLPSPAPTAWELDAEAIAVRIRWFGLLVGYLLVNLADHTAPRQAVLNALLTLGAVYTILDSYESFHGRVFLGRYPLVVSSMEALFIGLLCYYDHGLDSPFRYYYFLSLICCAIRQPSAITYLTCAFHCLSYGLLYFALPPERQDRALFALTLVMLGWVTWASNAMALLLKRVGDHLGRLNAALRDNQAELEARIAARTQELQEAQAHVLHQEKMATFGLLAAGIAHEVGNPLTSVSNLVQILQQRGGDEYTQSKLDLISGQLQRIRGTLRELTQFSRPASTERGRFALAGILDEAVGIAKYYKRTRGRIVVAPLPADLPPLNGVRDQLVQVFLNLILNAIDATQSHGRIEVDTTRTPEGVEISVRDDGDGISPEHAVRLFQPYFTTKKHGTGLGLFVTRQLVEDHGGTVAFASQAGQGTVFRVFLPLPAAEASVRNGQAPLTACAAP